MPNTFFILVALFSYVICQTKPSFPKDFTADFVTLDGPDPIYKSHQVYSTTLGRSIVDNTNFRSQHDQSAEYLFKNNTAFYIKDKHCREVKAFRDFGLFGAAGAYTLLPEMKFNSTSECGSNKKCNVWTTCREEGKLCYQLSVSVQDNSNFISFGSWVNTEDHRQIPLRTFLFSSVSSGASESALRLPSECHL